MAEYNGTIDLISGIRPKNNGNFPLVNAKDVLMPDGTRLSEFTGGTSADTPVFDLEALGLPAVPYGGTEAVSVETDTTEIMAALEKGVVIFKLNISLMGNVFPATIAANPLYMNGGYSWMLPQPQENGFITFALNVVEGAVLAQISFTPFDKVATNIDMSSFDTNGQIVETFADGSTKTSTIEFDTDGNPIKITDGDGNVTTITW